MSPPLKGELPAQAALFTVAAGRTMQRPLEVRAPSAGEVVVQVAGSALGAAPGAEISGVVVAAGEAAGEWLGRRVVVPRILPCGECDRCRRTRCFSCDQQAQRGPVATHETVPARYLLSLEPPLWPEGVALWQMAALADAAAVAYAALVRAQLGPGDLCAIIGAGVRGRLAARLARAMGAQVVMVESDPALRERISAAGLDVREVIEGHAMDGVAARARLAAVAQESGAARLEFRIVETTGTPAGRRRALDLLGPGDTAALLSGSDEGEVTVPLGAIVDEEAQIVGVPACHPDLYPELAARVVRGELLLEGEVRARPFTDLAEALAGVRTGHIRELPILVPAL
jgi:6-hydroxycyclohex-1-ene-1-carbonyl-CoA dehydrogenase